jgi:hypothetical protein
MVFEQETPEHRRPRCFRIAKVETHAVRISFQEAESLLRNVTGILLKAKDFQSTVAVKITDL